MMPNDILARKNVIFILLSMKSSIIRQIGHCIGGNFNIHIWAWSDSPSVQIGRF